jgi:thiol-disulfide isomerase/thioredoxin
VNPCRLVIVALALAPLGCGGGEVDPGFYEPVIVARGGDAPSTSAHARPPEPGPRFDKPKLVLITADWCTFCQAARPSIMEAYEPFRAKVELVELDVTDDFTTKESLRVAEEEGVRSFFERFHSRTPTVGVFVGVEDGRLVHGELEDPETLTRELDHAVRLMTQAPERDTVEAEHR